MEQHLEDDKHKHTDTAVKATAPIRTTVEQDEKYDREPQINQKIKEFIPDQFQYL